MAHPLRHFGGEVPLGVAYVNLTLDVSSQALGSGGVTA